MPSRSMSSPSYYVGLAKPIIKRGSFSGRAEYFYTEVIFALMEQEQDSYLASRWRFWSVTGGAYPYWFLSQNEFREINDGAYSTVPAAFVAQQPQSIYVVKDYAGCPEFWVHTPQFDPPGLYAVFMSRSCGLEQAFDCTGEDTFYLHHRSCPGQTDVTLLLNNVLQSPMRARF